MVNRKIVFIDWGGGLLPTLFSWAGNLWDCNEGLQHLRVYEPCETCESRPNCGTLTILISTKMRFVKEMWTQPTQSHWARKYCQCCLFYCSARFLGFMENSEMSHFVDVVFMVVKHHSWELLWDQAIRNKELSCNLCRCLSIMLWIFDQHCYWELFKFVFSAKLLCMTWDMVAAQLEYKMFPCLANIMLTK